MALKVEVDGLVDRLKFVEIEIGTHRVHESLNQCLSKSDEKNSPTICLNVCAVRSIVGTLPNPEHILQGHVALTHIKRLKSRWLWNE